MKKLPRDKKYTEEEQLKRREEDHKVIVHGGKNWSMANEKQSKARVNRRKDGRTMVQFNGLFKYKMRENQRKAVVDLFLMQGISVHSKMASTLGAIIEHCIMNNINFKLTNNETGFIIVKL